MEQRTKLYLKKVVLQVNFNKESKVEYKCIYKRDV